MLSYSRYVMESNNDLRISDFVVLKFKPTTPPCTLLLQNGEKILPNDGMKWTSSDESCKSLSSLNSLSKPAFLLQFIVPPPHSTEI